MTGDKPCRIAPFGDLRVNGHLHLSAAFRSLSRPSSADIAKASTVCSYYLSLCKIHTLTFLAFKISLDLLSFLRYVGKFMLMKFSFVSFLLYSFQRAGISYGDVFLLFSQRAERMVLSKLSSTSNIQAMFDQHISEISFRYVSLERR